MPRNSVTPGTLESSAASAGSTPLCFGVRSLIGLPVLVAVALQGLPVRALPNASVQLFRIDDGGVKAMPAFSAALEAARPARGPAATVLAQVGAAPAGNVTVLKESSNELTIRFADALPSNLSAPMSLRRVNADGTVGDELELIPLESPAVRISPDRRVLTITPTYSIRQGESVIVLLPTGQDYVLPARLTPCIFQQPIAALPLSQPVSVVAKPFPWWIIPVAAGVGVGICAVAGCFSDNGGGGNNPSSQ